MLGKLLKHEWRSTWKLPTALCCFTLLMTLIGALSFKMPMWQKLVGNNSSSVTFMDLMALAILITYFVAIIISSYAIMIYFAIRFYKNLYTDEGYLMFTLPTTPKKLILSKTLISGIWNLIASALMLGSMFLLLYVFIRTMISDSEWVEVSAAFDQLIPSINDAFQKFAGISMGFSIFIFAMIIIVSSFSGMLLIYLCICIGQLFKKHKVAASIITYLVVTTVVQTFTSVAMMPITFKLMFDMESIENLLLASPVEAMVAPMGMMMPIYYISLALCIVEGIAFFFTCTFISKRKLNLD